MVKLIGRVRFFRFRERTFFLTKLRKIPPFVFFLLPSGTKKRPDVIITRGSTTLWFVAMG